MIKQITPISLCFFSLIAAGCSDSETTITIDAGGSIDAIIEIDAAVVQETSIELSFVRVGNTSPHPFEVTATVSKAGEPSVGATLTVELTRGVANQVIDNGDGSYVFTVTPEQTGEHRVSVTTDGVRTSRTALVLSSVHADWGQAMSVEGLVNTEGYEDGVTISPDGEYLFVQYGPIYFSSVFLFNAPRSIGGCEGNRLFFPLNPTPVSNPCLHPWMDDIIGPIKAPERPGFYTGGISDDETMLRHNAASYGVLDNESPVIALPTMIFGFKRQPDNSFAEPFSIAFNDADDGLIGAFGISLLPEVNGTTTIAFAFNDPSNADMVDFDGNGSDDAESYFDVFTTSIILGEDTVLGTYVPTGTPNETPNRGTPFPSELVNFGKVGIEGIAGTQGNPHLLQANDGSIAAVFTDDEHDDVNDVDHGELSVYVLNSGAFPNGTWTKTVLPSTINKPAPSNEIQPFFGQNGLYFTSLGQDVPAIRFSAYSGSVSAADYGNNANWSPPIDIITAEESVIGGIVAIGEPTTAIVDSTETLYFVYASIRGFDAVSGLPDINMQAGFLPKN